MESLNTTSLYCICKDSQAVIASDDQVWLYELYTLLIKKYPIFTFDIQETRVVKASKLLVATKIDGSNF